MDLASGQVGSEGAYELKFEDGKAVLKVTHAHASGKVSLIVEEDAIYFMDKLKDAIPGKIDDAVIELLKGAVKAV